MSNNAPAEQRFSGLALSSGWAAARVCLFNENRHNLLPDAGTGVPPRETAAEILRFEQGLALAGERVAAVRADVLQRLGKAEAEIFTAQKMILDDPEIHARIKTLIRERAWRSESAVRQVLDEYEKRLLELDDEYIRERATDIGEVKRRLLDALANLAPGLQCAGAEHCQRGRHRILVASELTPALIVEVDAQNVRGFIAERGGPNAHAAILARALGVPAVSGIPNIHNLVQCGDEIVVDGDRGEVVLHPQAATLEMARIRHDDEPGAEPIVPPVPHLRVMANISVARHAAGVVRAQADGIGLYRTEFEFLLAGRELDEAEQFARYRQVLETLAGKPVTFRLLDLGGDKTIARPPAAPERNPALGWRGARLLLGTPDLLRAQARALARVADLAPIRILYPMITDVDQFLRLKALVLEALGAAAPRVEHGVMLEVPSACWQAREVLAAADFASVGTNDLLQFLVAVDRDNEKVAGDYRPDHPVLWSVLAHLADAARDARRPIAVCGEVAGDPRWVPRLMDLGFDTLSVSARRIPAVRTAALAYRKGQNT